jgi:hypothetical protein
MSPKSEQANRGCVDAGRICVQNQVPRSGTQMRERSMPGPACSGPRLDAGSRRRVAGALRAGALALSLALAPMDVAAEWAAHPQPAGPGAVARCVLESRRQPLSDGYQTSWAKILVDDRSVRVTSASILDPADGDIGLAVDGHAFVPADEVVDGRTAVFTARYETLVGEFRDGLRVRVQLRFWPTWPKTGTHSATFSLVGFTRAHERMGDCGTP